VGEWGYWINNQWIQVPRQPLINAGLKPPCLVTKPDGRVLEIVELDQGDDDDGKTPPG